MVILDALNTMILVCYIPNQVVDNMIKLAIKPPIFVASKHFLFLISSTEKNRDIIEIMVNPI